MFGALGSDSCESLFWARGVCFLRLWCERFVVGDGRDVPSLEHSWLHADRVAKVFAAGVRHWYTLGRWG